MFSNKAAKIFITAGVFLMAVIATVWQIVWFSSWKSKYLIAEGVRISGYDVGGYDIESARQLLDIHLQNEISGVTVDIYYEDIQRTLNEAFFADISYDKALDKAFSIARTGRTFDDYTALVKSKLFGISLDAEIVFDSQMLEEELLKVSDAFLIEPKNAQIESFDPSAEKGHRLSIVSQTEGRQLDAEKTSQSVKQAITEEKTRAQAYVTGTQADITYDILIEMEDEPVRSEYTLGNISQEYETAIAQVIGSGHYEILLPGQEISIIEYMGGEDYIYFEMPDGGTGSDYEKVLTQDFPTQIYIACLMSELETTERKVHEMYSNGFPAGVSTITNQYYDMKVKNTLSSPVIIRTGYERQGSSGHLYCEIYRPQMKYKTLVRSVIKEYEDKTFVDITRVYVDNKGNTIDSVVADTVEIK